jgi:hypothetical protein
MNRYECLALASVMSIGLPAIVFLVVLFLV